MVWDIYEIYLLTSTICYINRGFPNLLYWLLMALKGMLEMVVISEFMITWFLHDFHICQPMLLKTRSGRLMYRKLTCMELCLSVTVTDWRIHPISFLDATGEQHSHQCNCHPTCTYNWHPIVCYAASLIYISEIQLNFKKITPYKKICIIRKYVCCKRHLVLWKPKCFFSESMTNHIILNITMCTRILP